MKQHPSYSQFRKMRDQLSRIQEQLRQKKHSIPHDITIDNKSGKDLKFTINLLNTEPSISKLTLQSKIDIPNNSSVTHVIKNNEDYHHYDEDDEINYRQNEEYSIQVSRYITGHPNRAHKFEENEKYQSYTARHQQKFLPLSRLEKSIKEHEQNDRNDKQENEILIADDDEQSEINGNEQINQLTQSQYVKTATFTDRKIIQKRENDFHLTESDQNRQKNNIRIQQSATFPINLPFTIKKSIKNIEKPTQQTTQKKQPRHQLSDVKKSLTSIFNSLEQSNIKKSGQQPQTTWKIENITPSRKNIEIKQQNLKTYKQRSKDKQQFKKQKRQQRQNRLYEKLKTDCIDESCPKNSHFRCTSQSKQQIQANSSPRFLPQQKKQTKRADDLFVQRKDEYLKRLERQRQQINSIRKYSKDRHYITGHNKQSKTQPHVQVYERKTHISPRIQQIGNRLHSSKGKLPCQHFNRYSQSQERQRFNVLIKQNLLVSKYISRNEKEELFQSLVKSQDSFLLWPTKIANYTSHKLKRVASSIEKARA